MKKSEEERDSGIYSMCEEERETSYYGFEIHVSLTNHDLNFIYFLQYTYYADYLDLDFYF
jgi:hypothetical protein